MVVVDHALHVHQTRGIGTGNVLGSGLHVVMHLIAAHADGDGILFDREHASESAALISVRGLSNLNTFDFGEQITQFGEVGDIQLAGGGESHFTHSVARVVNADFVWESGIELIWADDIVNEFTNLPDAGVDAGMLSVLVG